MLIFLSISLFIILVILAFIISFPTSSLAEIMEHTWLIYSQNNASIVGIFTCLGATFTVCVFYTTYKATKNAEKNIKLAQDSIIIAEESLKLSRESTKKDDFIKQFTLLIEQHNKSHEIMMRNLDGYKIGNADNISWGMTLKKASDELYLNHKFSPYMRMLFRVLKHCDENFYMQGDTDDVIREKKKYTSIARSMIRNDVLYFVAINSMNSHSAFNDYREKLIKFNFFEHLIPDSISDSIKFSVDDFYGKKITSVVGPVDRISLFIKAIIDLEFKNIINERIKYEKFHFSDQIINNNINDIPYSFNYEIASLYVKYKYKSFLTSIENLIDYNCEFVSAWQTNKIISSRKPIFNNKYYIYIKDESNTSGYRRLDSHEYTTEIISKIIMENNLSADDLNEKIIKETAYHDLNFSKNKTIDYIETGTFISPEMIYNECKELMALKVRDSLKSEKELIFSKIMNITIDRMNETSLIKKSGEKFTTYNEIKIVFKNNK